MACPHTAGDDVRKTHWPIRVWAIVLVGFRREIFSISD